MRIACLEFCRLRSGSRPREGKLLFGRINRHDRCRVTTSNNLPSEGTVAAADVEPSKAFWKVEPREESVAYNTAPTAHHALIGFAVCKKLGFVHVHLAPVFFVDCSIVTAAADCLEDVRFERRIKAVVASHAINSSGRGSTSYLAAARTAMSVGLSPLKMRS